MIWRGTIVSESPYRLQQPVRDGPWFIAGCRKGLSVRGNTQCCLYVAGCIYSRRAAVQLLISVGELQYNPKIIARTLKKDKLRWI